MEQYDSHPSKTIQTSLSIYAPLLCGGFLLFELIRTHFQPIRKDSSRSFYTEAQSKRTFGWIPIVYSVPESEWMDICGFDAVTYFRFLDLGRKFSLLTIVLSVILFPLYATSGHHTDAVDPLTKLTLASMQINDSHLWACVIASYILCGFVMYLLREEYIVYVRRRHQALSADSPAQYTVLLHDIPHNMLSEKALHSYFSELFPNISSNVYIVLDCRKLDKLIEEQQIIQHELKAAQRDCEYDHLAVKSRSSEHKCCAFTAKCCKLKSIDELYEESRRLDDKISKELYRLEKAKTDGKGATQAGKQSLYSAANSSRFDTLSSPRRVKTPSLSLSSSVCEDALHRDDPGRTFGHTWEPAREKSTESPMTRSAAFVTFSSLTACQLSQQSLQSNEPGGMKISAAPHFDDVNWLNIGVGFKTRKVWMLLSTMITAVLVLFWTIPTAFVASLASIDSIRRSVPFLDRAFRAYPILQSLFQQLSPLALLILNALANALLKFLSNREGHPSYTQTRASMFTKLAYFQLLQTFFVTVIVGTVLDSLLMILDSPKQLISMLGRSVPHQSTFFMSYVIILTGLGLTMELLCVEKLVLSLFCRVWSRTRAQEAKVVAIFDPTRAMADCYLVMLVSFTFAIIAPLVCYVTGCYFIIAKLVYQQQALYLYKASKVSTGEFWPRLFRFTIIALVVSQLTLLGLLSLKRAVIPFLLVSVLTIMILVYRHYMVELYERLAMHLPLAESLRLDRSKSYLLPEDASGLYFQPLLKKCTLRKSVLEQSSTDDDIVQPLLG
nr:conserved hypothetical protein [Albugo laibachii Nc14]|eukprot:CCA25856.1 conserved hypothetical protein [Albugo laibachii Nc14]